MPRLPQRSIRILASLMPMAGLLLFLSVATASAGAEEGLTVVVEKGQSLRDLAERHLGDPDLWPEILRVNELADPSDVRVGMRLLVPRGQVLGCTEALGRALAKIQEATEKGAKVFATDPIRRALSLRDRGLERRKASDWSGCREQAGQSWNEAEKALNETLSYRSASAEALLSRRSGRVDTKKPGGLEWLAVQSGEVLVERETIRTLSQSAAEILLADESQLRLSSNSQAVIRKLRVDRLNDRYEAKVSLVEGDVFALLGSSPKSKALELDVPGIETKGGSLDFWVSRKGKISKIANFDEAEMVIASGGGEVRLAKNQGTRIEEGATPSAVHDLLAAPSLLQPPDDQRIFGKTLDLGWSPVESAVAYRLEIAADDSFRSTELSRRLKGNEGRTPDLGDGAYYWRVAAIDELGFPGSRSIVRRFHILSDAAAPFLVVRAPAASVIVRRETVWVEGSAEVGGRLTLDGRPVQLDPKGDFRTEIELAEGINNFALEVVDAAGNSTRRERMVVLMPDRPARILWESSLPQTGGAFLTRQPAIQLRGITLARARLRALSSEGGLELASALTDDEGAFVLQLPLAPGRSEARLEITSPSGFVSEERLTLERDDRAPELRVEPPPGIVAEPSLTLEGTVTGADRLRFGTGEIATDGGRFTHTVVLEPGENFLTIEAGDQAGNTIRWQAIVLLDREPPKLVRHEVTPGRAKGGETVEITVEAEDRSGLQRVATFELSVGSFRHRGQLLLDRSSSTFRASVPLPGGASGAVRLLAVSLEDYHGNRHSYSLDGAK